MIKNLFLSVALFLLAHAALADPISAADKKAVVAAAEQFKKSALAKDYETVVSLLYPELIKASGGKEKTIEMLKAEDAKNQAAGIVIESMSVAATDTMYTGTEFKLTFVTATMVVKIGETRMQSKSFQIAFSQLKSDRWYLLDGTRITMPQFRGIFKGFPDDLKLPAVEKRQL